MSPYPLLVALGLVLTWWGWKTGAFFGDVLIPGVIVLSGITAVMVIRAPWQADVRGPAKVAFAALCGLAAWTLLSFLWTPAKEVAIADAERVVAYALLFVLGAWLALLLEREMTLAAVPVIVAGAAVGLATTLTIALGGDTASYLDLEGLLSYPLGYHNAVAAFLMVCAIPALALITREELQWPLRSALASTVTIAVGLTILTQSRGAVVATAVGLLAVILLSRSRLGTLGWTAIAVVPALLILPLLLGVYSAASEGVEAAGDELQRAGFALILAAAASAALAAAVARSPDRFDLPDDTRRRVGTAVVAAAVLVVLVPTIVVVARDGGPASFLDRRIDELSAGSPDVSEGGTRIGVNLGSDRGTLWAVALDDVAGAPMQGEGAGGFEYSFLAERDSPGRPDFGGSAQRRPPDALRARHRRVRALRDLRGGRRDGVLALAAPRARGGDAVGRRSRLLRLLGGACVGRLVLALPGGDRPRRTALGSGGDARPANARAREGERLPQARDGRRP